MKVRLVSSDTKGYISHGYVEVFHQGRWGAICADDWDDNDAYVACGQLGYPNFKVSFIHFYSFIKLHERS